MLTKPFTLSPAPAWPTGLRYIQNGDALNTGNHETQAADVAQALSHLKGAISGDSAVAVNLAPTTANDFTATAPIKTDMGSITRVMQVHPATDNASVWTIGITGNAEQASSTVANLIYWLDIPNGATLTAVSVDVTGATGHSSLPTGTDRAHIEVGYVSSPSGGGGLGVQYDASASVEDYEEAHQITLSVSSHVVNRTSNRYYALVRGERGGNYVAGLQVRNVRCTFTPASYDPG
ncbi:hypothetical protein WMF30_10435 [Sorangium sp. So ce134]